MARIAGVDLPEYKRIDIALTAIYGIGRSNVTELLKQTNITPQKRTRDLTEAEIGALQLIIEKNVKVEGDLRQEVAGNIKRLKQIGSYRGMRHIRNLPVYGQRTRSNARTKRGKRVTIGAMRKEVRAKMEQPTAEGKTEVKNS